MSKKKKERPVADEATEDAMEADSAISIDESEVIELSSQLSEILDWVEQLNEVNTDNVEPLNSVSKTELPLREDLVNNVDQLKDVMSNAPEKLENYFVVPKVVE